MKNDLKTIALKIVFVNPTGGGGAHCAHWSGKLGGKFFFIGQKIWPHRLVCRWPQTDSGLFGTLESKKN